MRVPIEAAVPIRDAVRVSVVIPCLNEAESIGQCVITAKRVLDEHGLDGEVIVVDNASDDGSGDLAALAGARVVDEPRRGYGSAYLAGFAAARGEYIVMIDADLTYDFEEIPRFVHELDSGGDLVMGNRMQAVQPGAMSALSRIGNPLLSGFLNLLFRTPVRDAHCGMRALRRITNSTEPAVERECAGGNSGRHGPWCETGVRANPARQFPGSLSVHDRAPFRDRTFGIPMRCPSTPGHERLTDIPDIRYPE